MSEPRNMITSLLDDFGMFQNGKYVLDVGCRNGVFMECAKDRDIRYRGFDVDRKCVLAARERFKGNINFTVSHINVYNKVYNPEGQIDPKRVNLPYITSHFDTVIVSSVFTHLGTEPVAFRYIKEIRRVMKTGGLAYFTWFRSPPNKVDYGEERTVYNEGFIINLLAGFLILHTEGGLTDEYHDQWKMVVSRL